MGVSESEVLRRVEEFDCRYGRMERVLWCLSKEARTCLIRKERREVVEAFGRRLGASRCKALEPREPGSTGGRPGGVCLW